jgi:PPOX class probable F420-dependent enzyme
VDEGEAVKRLRAARVGRLATVTPPGSPHVVPLVFVVLERDGGLVAYWVVDEKPKRSRRLQRLRNIETNPSVAILVDQYGDDWGRLWWVRADGTGRVVRSRSERVAVLDALRAKYPQYAIAPPAGPVVAVDIERVTGWTASDASPAVRRRKT